MVPPDMKPVCMVVQNIYDIDPRVRRKAEALVAAGYSVDVLALRGDNGDKCYQLNGVNVRTLSLGKKRGSLLRYLFEFAAFFFWVFIRVPLQMMRRRYGVIDVNTLPDFLIFAPIIAKWMGAGLVLDMHEIAPEFYMSKYRCTPGSVAVRVVTYLERVSMRFADRVITINEPIEDLLASRGLSRSKSTIIMNAVDEARFAGYTNSPGTAERVDPTRFVMMYHGTLTRIYGLDIAVRAFALAHAQMPGAELWILGSGPEKNNLADLARTAGIQTKVRLVGQVDASEIPDWLNQCDAGILPIHQDIFLDFAFPNKLPEFIVMGKPVLISRLKTIRHYFSDEALAYFDPSNPADLAKQMVRVYGDSQLRFRLVQKARTEYAPMRWELMKKRYVGMIEQLAGIPAKTALEEPPNHASAVVTLDVLPQQPGSMPYE